MSLASWMVQTAYVASVTATDSYGKPTYETPRSIGVRVQAQRRMVKSPKGEEAVSNHVLWSLSPVLLTDRLWLPGASTTSAEASNVPLAVTSVPDKTGARTIYKVEL